MVTFDKTTVAASLSTYIQPQFDEDVIDLVDEHGNELRVVELKVNEPEGSFTLKLENGQVFKVQITEEPSIKKVKRWLDRQVQCRVRHLGYI